MNEVKQERASCFATLTYDDEHLPKNKSVSVQDCQKFIKRLRKNSKKKIRYFLGAEYGDENKRPHYHVILFGLSKEDLKTIESSWGLGFVTVGDVTYDSAAYVAGYTLKKLSGDLAFSYTLRGVKPEFGTMSRRPGIGAGYLKTNAQFLKTNGFCVAKGNKVAIPRYYADKVFVTDEDKSQLRAKRQAVIDEGFALSKQKSGLNQDFQVADYQRMERSQGERDLQIRQDLKKRKL